MNKKRSCENCVIVYDFSKQRDLANALNLTPTKQEFNFFQGKIYLMMLLLKGDIMNVIIFLQSVCIVDYVNYVIELGYTGYYFSIATRLDTRHFEFDKNEISNFPIYNFTMFMKKCWFHFENKTHNQDKLLKQYSQLEGFDFQTLQREHGMQGTNVLTGCWSLMNHEGGVRLYKEIKCLAALELKYANFLMEKTFNDPRILIFYSMFINFDAFCKSIKKT